MVSAKQVQAAANKQCLLAHFPTNTNQDCPNRCRLTSMSDSHNNPNNPEVPSTLPPTHTHIHSAETLTHQIYMFCVIPSFCWRCGSLTGVSFPFSFSAPLSQTQRPHCRLFCHLRRARRHSRSSSRRPLSSLCPSAFASVSGCV